MRLIKSLFIVPVLSVVGVFVNANVIVPMPPQIDATAYILMDSASGHVIVEKNADQRLPPASLTKLMTSYVAVHELELGNVTEETPIPISVNAWRKGGSKMFVREGTQVPLIDILRGIIVQSGNDASVAVAEYFAGSEAAYAQWMNQYAQEFGLTNTNFVNATGWPEENHYSSARDMAILSRHVIYDHAQYYPLYAERHFEFNNIRQPNRNRLLWRDPSVDGLKTGHTNEAGYCLAATAKQDDTRLIAIVFGARSDEARTRETQKLLGYGFRYFETHKVHDANEVLQQTRVWLGQNDAVELVLTDDLFLSLPRGSRSGLDASIDTQSFIEAPIEAGQVLATLTIRRGDEVLAQRDLVAKYAVESSGWFGRMMGRISLFFARLFQ